MFALFYANGLFTVFVWCSEYPMKVVEQITGALLHTPRAYR